MCYDAYKDDVIVKNNNGGDIHSTVQNQTWDLVLLLDNQQELTLSNRDRILSVTLRVAGSSSRITVDVELVDTFGLGPRDAP